MDIKTQRELAFFMAGIECGRMFDLVHMSTSKMGLDFQSVDDETQLNVSLMCGFIGYEGDQDKWPNDCRHAAVRGILADALRDAKTAFQLRREILREREQMLIGGENDS